MSEPTKIAKLLKRAPMPGAGRPIGASAVKTLAWNAMGDYITDRGAKRLTRSMTAMNDKEFISVYLKLLQYFKPKMLSSTTKSEGSIQISVVTDPAVLDSI